MATKKIKLTSQTAWETQKDLNDNFSELETRLDELDIPTKTSDLTNDSGFIDKTVNDLVNYYTKNDTYSKTEVNTLISGLKTINYEIVSTLPTPSATTYFNESKTIYMTPVSTGSGDNYYNEYITTRSGSEGAYTYSWELIGSTQVDLSNYVKKNATITVGGNTIHNNIVTDDSTYGGVLIASGDNEISQNPTEISGLMVTPSGTTLQVTDSTNNNNTTVQTLDNKIQKTITTQGTENSIEYENSTTIREQPAEIHIELSSNVTDTSTQVETTYTSGIDISLSEIDLDFLSINPKTNNKTNLGNSTNKFKNLYLAGKISDGTNEYTLPSSTGTLALLSDITSGITDISFTSSDAGWSATADANGFYTLTIPSTGKPIIVYNSNGEQVLAGLKSDGTNVYIVTDTKFTGSVSVR